MKVDIAIITIREDEFMAVRKRFTTKRQWIPDGRTYLIGEVKTEKRVYTIAIARCSEQGTDASQRLAHHIIHNLDPQFILVVGIAGGVPRDEFTLGDVVVSTRIINPNVDAWHSDGTKDFTTRGGPPHPLVENIVGLLPGEPQLAGWTDTVQLERPTLDPTQENITGDDEWRERVRRSLNWHFGEERNQDRPPKFAIGHILSSNHLVKDPTRLSEILKTHRSIFAVEMEVAGVYEAAQGMDHQYPVMAIRGISDIVGLQRDGRWTEYACQTAAAFTYAFIMTDPLDLPLNSASFQTPVISSEAPSDHLRDSKSNLDSQQTVRHQGMGNFDMSKRHKNEQLFSKAGGDMITTGDFINSAHIAIGRGAQVSGNRDLISPATDTFIDSQTLRSVVTELYMAFGQTDMPINTLISVQSVAGTALKESDKGDKVNCKVFIPQIKTIGDTLAEANVVVQQGTLLWQSVTKLAQLLGPLVVGGAQAVAAWFGVYING